MCAFLMIIVNVSLGPLSQASSTGSSRLEDIIVDSDENTQMLLDEFLGVDDPIDGNEVFCKTIHYPIFVNDLILMRN